MSINPNKRGVADGKGMIQRLNNARKKAKKRMGNYWMSINPNKGPADRERMIQQH